MTKTAILSLNDTLSAEQKIALVFKNEASKLLSFIRKRVPTHVDAEDILQDVFSSFSENVLFANEINFAGAWLYRVAKNRITDLFRKKKPQLLEDVFSTAYSEEEDSRGYEDFISAGNPETETKLENKGILLALNTALEKLPIEQKNVFVATEIEGKSFKQISNETGEKVPTLISRKRYAVLSLRKDLKHLYNEL
jgi:RNA polymerase sigma factor (sigma-70 family)